MSTEDRRQLIEHMINSLQMPSKRLSSWELQFLESVNDQFTDRGSLSQRQFEKLESIYTEKTA